VWKDFKDIRVQGIEVVGRRDEVVQDNIVVGSIADFSVMDTTVNGWVEDIMVEDILFEDFFVDDNTETRVHIFSRELFDKFFDPLKKVFANIMLTVLFCPFWSFFVFCPKLPKIHLFQTMTSPELSEVAK